MSPLFRKLLVPLFAPLFAAVAISATAQTVNINGVDCTTGSVTFGGLTGKINVLATGACVTSSVPAPTLTFLSPNSGIPGATITANGTNFAAGASVTVGSTAATGVTFLSGTSLSFLVPAVAAGTPNVFVSINGQSSNTLPLTVSAATPTISNIAPAMAAPGTTTTITGTNFASGATVTINGVNAPVSAVTSTTITITVPAIATGMSYPVVVNIGGSTASSTLQITAANPVITGLPAAAAINSLSTITGTGFAPGATVQIANMNAQVIGTPTATTIVVTVPIVATGAQVIAVTVAGVTATGVLNVTASSPAPTVTGCTGTVGGSMTIAGTNFVAGATLVTLNGTSASTTVVTGISIAATVPAGVTAGSPALVVTVSGQSANSTCIISVGSSLPISVDVSMPPNPIPVPSKVANILTPAHAGPNGANGFSNRQNAWQVSATGFCGNSTPAITKIWYHNLDYTTYVGSNQVEYFGVNANEALVYSFIAPPDGTSGSMQVNESTVATLVGNFVSISLTPCDFDAAKLNDGSGCYNNRNGPNTTSYLSTTSPAPVLFQCKLTPGTRYYLNYRNWSPSPSPNDACLTTTGLTGIPCGGLFTLK